MCVFLSRINADLVSVAIIGFGDFGEGVTRCLMFDETHGEDYRDLDIHDHAPVFCTGAIKEMLSGHDMTIVLCDGEADIGTEPLLTLEVSKFMGVLTVAFIKYNGTEAPERFRKEADTVFLQSVILEAENNMLLDLSEKNRLGLVDDTMRICAARVQAFVDAVVPMSSLGMFLEMKDIRDMFEDKGTCYCGVAGARGKNRESEALKKLSLPVASHYFVGLFGDVSLNGIRDATEIIRKKADEDTEMLLATYDDELLPDECKVVVIACGRSGGPSFTPQPAIRTTNKSSNILIFPL